MSFQLHNFEPDFGSLIQKRHLETIEAIKSVTDKFYITGSIALSLLGIIRRQINDVDIVVWDKSEMQKIYETFGGEFYENYDQEKPCDMTDFIPNHLRFQLAGIPVCVFYMQHEKTQDVVMNGVTYCVSNPQSIIAVKFNYIRNAVDSTTPESKKRLLKNLNDISDYTFYLTK